MSPTTDWTEEHKDAWYAESEDAAQPATHVVTIQAMAKVPIVVPPWQTDKAEAIAAEIAAAWQDLFRDEGVEWEWIEEGHPAIECLSADERPQLDLGIISIEETS